MGQGEGGGCEAECLGRCGAERVGLGDVWGGGYGEMWGCELWGRGMCGAECVGLEVWEDVGLGWGWADCVGWRDMGRCGAECVGLGDMWAGLQ